MRDAQIGVVLVPRGGRDAIEGWQGASLCVRVSAPPVDGRANAALVHLIARAAGVAPSRVRIVSGLGSRRKRLAIEGIEQEELEQRLGRV